MDMIADILLAAGALGAAFYCFVLGRRLKRFNDLEKGMGGAVAVLSAQVDDLSKTLTAAQVTAGKSAQSLTELSQRAEQTAQRLELQMASLHDLPGQPTPANAASAKQPTERVEEVRPPEPPASGQPMFVRRATQGDAA